MSTMCTCVTQFTQWPNCSAFTYYFKDALEQCIAIGADSYAKFWIADPRNQGLWPEHVTCTLADAARLLCNVTGDETS